MSKDFNRALINGITAGREDSRWKDERIAELTRQRDSYRHSANDLATRCARDEERIAELEAREQELEKALTLMIVHGKADLLNEHDFDFAEEALAKIDKEPNNES